MHFYQLLTLLYVSVASAFYEGVDISSPTLPTRRSNLKASKRYDHLLIRNDDFYLQHEIRLAYAEPEKGDRPTLLLEDFDHHFEEIKCNDMGMTAAFKRREIYVKACTACILLVGELLISSHYSCGEDGAHTVYRVKGVTFDDVNMSIQFILQETIAEHEYDRMTIEFGPSTERYTVHQHDRLFRRSPQATLPPTQTSLPSGVSSYNPTGTLVVQQADTSDVTYLGFSEIDTTFLEGTSFEDLNSIGLGCENCTAKGEMIITTGKFEVDFGWPWTGKDDDPIVGGFVQLEVTGYQMSIGLKAEPWIPFKRERKLFGYTPVGFTIPKLGSFGISIELVAFIDIEVEGAIELGFGFDVNVPPSRARIDVAEWEQSGIWGFNETTITPKIISSNVSNLELFMEVGLRPRIVAGLSLDNLPDFNAGPYLTLPSVKINVTQLATNDVGANCESGGDSDIKFEDAFQNLTHVNYSLNIAAGLGMDVGIIPLSKDLFDIELLGTTHCLVYQTIYDKYPDPDPDSDSEPNFRTKFKV
ncbi:hypothetical protein P154DRAFT_575483 [Amniculicola lignicola CBS 123094]|uniref:DUF7029 domain-containing protein n=1 Tax=Amniculicola lignicola CBS 123094 TaxID=1392246 RepID=A0A6A5WPV4_9PLEO|nr:hypothetical protein P154DRAFT_575483 [Amniculicola lignicola CBS 123094]